MSFCFWNLKMNVYFWAPLYLGINLFIRQCSNDKIQIRPFERDQFIPLIKLLCLYLGHHCACASTPSAVLTWQKDLLQRMRIFVSCLRTEEEQLLFYIYRTTETSRVPFATAMIRDKNYRLRAIQKRCIEWRGQGGSKVVYKKKLHLHCWKSSSIM